MQTKGNIVDGEFLPGATGTDFGVFGFRPDGAPIFDRYSGGTNSTFDNIARQYRTAFNSSFKYDLKALWHNGAHTFYAYYPYDSGKNMITAAGVDSQSRPYIEYTQPTTLETMADVMTGSLVATSSDRSQDKGELWLPFRHRLFALSVILNNKQTDSGQSLKIKAADITLYNIASAAYLYYENVLTGTLSPDLQVNTYTTLSQSLLDAEWELGVSASLDFNSVNSFLLIPCESLKAKVTLTLVDSWGEEGVFEVDCSTSEGALAPAGGFKAGYKYVLTINKTDKSLTFECTREDWTSKDVDMEFN